MSSDVGLRGPPGERSLSELLRFGVLNLDKPAGPSSHQVAAWVRDMIDDALATMNEPGIDRAAHAGTLDPKVTGCLPLLLGTGTRCVPGLEGGQKSYIAVLELHAAPPDDLADRVGLFEGELYQRPPRKSAVARRLRTREVFEIEILDTAERQVLIQVRCEPGTYIRKLCHDIGLALGTGAHMGDLRRIGTTPFDDRELVTLHDLADGLAAWTEDGTEDWLREVVQPAEAALSHLPTVTIAESAAEQVAEGAPVYAPGVIRAESTERDSQVVCLTPEGAAICLGRLVGDPDQDSEIVVDLDRVLV